MVAALAITIGCYGLMYDNLVLAVISGLSFIACIFGWAFEGVGGHHLHFDTEEAA